MLIEQHCKAENSPSLHKTRHLCQQCKPDTLPMHITYQVPSTKCIQITQAFVLQIYNIMAQQFQQWSRHPEAHSYWHQPYHSWSGRQCRNHRLCWDKWIWDGSYETYHAFFAHLRCKLDNILKWSGIRRRRSNCWLKRGESFDETVFYKQLHFFAVDIFRKMCDDTCRIKYAFPRKCGRILSGVSLVLRDLQAGASRRLLTHPDAF